MTRFYQPLQTRFLGFDNLFREMDRLLGDAHTTVATGFPPFNLYKEKNGYSIELALAGYKKEDIFIKHDKKNGTLTIGSNGSGAESQPEDRELLRGGIAARSFERIFTVADNLVVKGAELKDGMLTVQLEVVEREEDKPLLITVN
jgi:molecular chaperone IbpA